jgi:hypothetical protein
MGHCMLFSMNPQAAVRCGRWSRGIGMLALAAAVHEVHAEDGQGAFMAWISPTIQPMVANARFGVDEEVPASVKGEDAEYSRLTLRGSVQAQLYHDQHQELQLTASVVDAKIDSSATFPQTELTLPERLYDIRLGASYRTVRHDGSIYGAQVSVGNSSPVDLNSDNLTFSATLFTRQPSTKNNAWLFFIAYSDDRAVLNYIPFPGFLYLWNPNPHWHIMAGLPILSAAWTPTTQFKADALLSGFGSAHAGITDSPLKRVRPWHLRLSADWGGDVFRRSDFSDHTDHIIFRSIRYTAGSSLNFGPNRSLDVYGGYATDRQIIEGRDLFNNGNHIDLHSGAVFGGSGQWGF